MRLKYNSYDGTIINLSNDQKIIKHEKNIIVKILNIEQTVLKLSNEYKLLLI